MEAVDNAGKNVRVERLVKSCERAMTKSFSKDDQLYSFANKTTDPEALKSWPSDVTLDNDKVFKKAREYIDGLPKTHKTSQSSVKTDQKAKSASQTSKPPHLEFLRHLAGESRNLSLQYTDARKGQTERRYNASGSAEPRS